MNMGHEKEIEVWEFGGTVSRGILLCNYKRRLNEWAITGIPE